MKHDREVTAMFEVRGWTVVRIWECELKKANREYLLSKIQESILQPKGTAKKEREKCQ